MERTVVVTGVGGPAGNAAARWFHGRGLPVLGTDVRDVASPGSFRRATAAADRWFASEMLAMVETERPGLLVPTVSEELPAVAAIRPAIVARGCGVAIGPALGVEIAGDKLRTAEACASAGVPVPATLPGATPRAAVVRELGLPLLSKPRVGRGGRGVRVWRSEGDVLSAPDADVVWQEFVAGEELDVSLYLERGGEIAAAVVLRKTSLRGGEVGNAASVERCEAPDVLGVAVRAARALDLWGPLDVDVRRRKDGTPVLLEVNARLGAHSLAAAEVLEALLAAWRLGRCNT